MSASGSGRSSTGPEVPRCLRKRRFGTRARPDRLRAALARIGRPYRCAACGNPGQWRGCGLRLDIDHVNGDPLDDRPENLRYLCPNCHRITPTWGHRPPK